MPLMQNKNCYAMFDTKSALSPVQKYVCENDSHTHKESN